MFPRGRSAFGVCLLALSVAAGLPSQNVGAQPSATTPPQATMRGTAAKAHSATAGARETSVSLGQIVARQRETLSRLRTARGVAVWREDVFSTTAQSTPPLRLVYFAYTTTASVNLIVAWDGKTPVGRSKEQLDWSRVLAAYLVRDDTVYEITPGKATRGWVRAMPYNPAVHERNPLVRFSLDWLDDEPVTLADLYDTRESMAARPTVQAIGAADDERLRVVFSNPAFPSDALIYVVNPRKGYLNEYIVRQSGGRKIFETSIFVTRLPSGVWAPGKRTKWEYGADGRLVRRSEWYFHSLEVNQSFAPNEFSLAYFHLPKEAWPSRVQTNASDSERPAERATVTPRAVVPPRGAARNR